MKTLIYEPDPGVPGAMRPCSATIPPMWMWPAAWRRRG
jgi:hypothetical protein